MSRRREAWIGLTVLLGIVVFVFLYTYIRDIRWWSGGVRVHAVVENAGRVTSGVPVMMKGVDVGQVTDRRLRPDLRVVLTLEIEDDVPVPADSRIELGSISIFGEPAVTLIPGTSSRPVEQGDTLAAGVEPTPTELFETLGGRARDVLSPDFITDLQATVREFREAAQTLNELLVAAGPEMSKAAESFRKSAAGLERVTTGPDLESTAQNLAMTSEQLQLMASGLSGSALRLEAILAKVDEGQGSLGRFVNDPALYEDLRALTASYRNLADDIRQNPKRYVNVSVF
jgi:phospholipid/cholesterol/gamma-HCH transport system substrate-binding protein